MKRSLLAVSLVVSACGSDDAVMADPGDPGSPDKRSDAAVMRDAGRDASSSRIDASTVRPPVTPREDAGGCDNALEITVRDFTEAHPDFEKGFSQLKGMVRDELGADHKPVYASDGPTAGSSGPDNFKQWYNDVDGVNIRLSYRITFTEKSEGSYVYDSSAFFPIDAMGFGNGPNSGGVTIPGLGTIGGGTAQHNFLFTTEAHTKFSYQGGEKFSFTGDDDLWVFLNNKLAIDLGGLHSQLSATVDLDAEAQRLGLTKGNTYPMDIFHAERHTDQSNYHIETTIDLSCIENVPII